MTSNIYGHDIRLTNQLAPVGLGRSRDLYAYISSIVFDEGPIRKELERNSNVLSCLGEEILHAEYVKQFN